MISHEDQLATLESQLELSSRLLQVARKTAAENKKKLHAAQEANGILLEIATGYLAELERPYIELGGNPERMRLHAREESDLVRKLSEQIEEAKRLMEL